MNKLLIGILILTLNSCHLIGKGNGIELAIENKSDFLTMKDNKSDGNYVLEFTRNGKKEIQGYGYYTNGGALDKWVEFEIENDTITKRFSGIKY